jgi:uncharacterized membrane protein
LKGIGVPDVGFVFGLVGALLGMFLISTGRPFFGLLVGMMIGWLLSRLLNAQTTIRRLVDRVDNLEQRNAATAPLEKVAKKSFDTPERVSIYEPPPVAPPPVTPPPPEPASSLPVEATPKPAADVHARTPNPEPQPGMGEHTIDVAKRWLTTGNVPVKVGVIISFFGVAFLLKYAVEQELFSIPMSVRYLAVAGFATFLLSFGWRKRNDNRVFALSIQGGGIGVLFLTVFAALRLHELLSPAVAFGFLILITSASGFLAIRQDSRAFAILGTTGGFLAPLLVSTGAGNHVGLFSYYLILNCAILGVAWYRAWRELNIIGFGFTFVVGTIWGYQYYVPELFATTEPFLVLYFLFYTIIAVLFAFRQRPELRGYVDGTLLFGTPTIAFALQTQLLNDTEYGLAISAAVVAVFYAAMALWLRRTQEKNFELLTQAFVALAVAFGTIAIPLALDDRWTAIAWAMEGAALVWIGVRQTTTLARMTGAALAFAGGAEFLSYGWVDNLGIPVFNGNFIGGVLIALTSLYSSYMLLKDEHGREWQKLASGGLLIWGLMWWFGTGFAEISDRGTNANELAIALVYFGSSFIAMKYAANRLQWLSLWQITLGFLPLAGGAGLIAHGWTDNLGIPVLNGNFLGGAMIAWMSLYSARKLRTDERADKALRPLSVGLLIWGLLFWFGAGSAEIFDRVWGNSQLHALLLFGTLSLSAIAYAGKRFDWVAYSRVSLALLPALFVGAIAYLLEHDHFFKGLGALGWLVAIAAHVWILYCCDDKENRAETTAHGWGVIFFTGLLALEVSWQIERVVYNDVWSGSAALLVVALAAFALLFERRKNQNRSWPFSRHSGAYFLAALLMVIGYMVLVIGVSLNDPGDPAPVPYIPVLNPLDVLSIVAVALTWYALRLEQQSERWRLGEDSRKPQLFLLGLALLLSTIAVVRIVHHTTGVAWHPDALMNSVGVQSTLSIYWAILGLSGMVIGTKRSRRSIWMMGAGLMVIVVLKLFAIDLGNTGTVARIVSFLGVGVMLLVVGYFSPVPPRKPDTSSG